MLVQFRTLAASACGLLLFSHGAWAQISAIEGDVKGVDGLPVKGAQILIERKDKKGTYKGARTDRKGHYIYNGLPLGTYKVSLIVGDNVVDFLDDVKTRLGDPSNVSFDLKTARQQRPEQVTSALPPNASDTGPSPTNPDGPRVRMEIERIESAADVSTLPAPLVSDQAISLVRGVSRTFNNQTAYVLIVLLTGPVNTRIVVPAATKRTIEIPAGRYKVAARLLAPDFPPLFGVEEYVSSHDYKSQFVIQ